MNTPNENENQPENHDAGKEPAGCGPGCDCQPAGRWNKARWIVGAIVLVAAGVLVVRGMVKSDKGTASACCPGGFATPGACQTAEGTAGVAEPSASAGESSIGSTISGFSELNTVASKTDAVFVYIPGKDSNGVKTLSAAMSGAARAIESKGLKCALFTLKPGSADYDQVLKQVSAPGVLALVKGRGMSTVTGEITEAKLVQGYVAASTAGGCGPNASAGCCPK